MHTLTILDWDDTLFPTNWVISTGINLHDIKVRSKFAFLFGKLLEQLLLCGDVVIITNAMPEWVHTSMNVLPLTSQIIDSKINIISARKLYQHHVETIDWKKHAFRDHFTRHYSNKKEDYQNVISIGDAEYERRALIQLYGWDDHQPGKRFLKTIRFIQVPSFTVLVDQLIVLTSVSRKICSLRKHVELEFGLK